MELVAIVFQENIFKVVELCTLAPAPHILQYLVLLEIMVYIICSAVFGL